MNWTQNKMAARPTWVMDADPRYTVEQWGLGSWQVYLHGFRINPDHQSLGSRLDAMDFAVAHRNSPEQKLARLAELTGTILTAYEQLVQEVDSPIDAAYLGMWHAQLAELVGGQS